MLEMILTEGVLFELLLCSLFTDTGSFHCCCCLAHEEVSIFNDGLDLAFNVSNKDSYLSGYQISCRCSGNSTPKIYCIHSKIVI